MGGMTGIEWSTEVSAADWIVDRLGPFGGGVGSTLPSGYEAYARILHPWWQQWKPAVTVTWTALAAEAGVSLCATTQFEALEAVADARDCVSPLEGTMIEDDLRALIGLLGPATGTPDSCWFAVWEGWGGLQGPPAVAVLSPRKPPGAGPPPPADEPTSSASGLGRRVPASVMAGPRVEIPQRPMLLHRGAIDAVTALCPYPVSQSPNLWWPDDRAWCVASEIDFRSTYVGGSRALIAAILAAEGLEAIPAKDSDPVRD